MPIWIDGIRIWLKLEGQNPTGSVKDRAAVAMLRGRIRSGELHPESIILDASNGNMASALACYGRALGLETHIVCTAPTATERQMIDLFGATLIENDLGPHLHDGHRKCLELVNRRDQPYCYLDQLHNPNNPRAHETETGPEILRGLPGVRLIVGSLGTGGTMLGVGRAVRRLRVMVAAVTAAPGSRMPGLGSFADGDRVSPFITQAEEERLFSACEQVTTHEATHWQRALVDHGLSCGLQTGAVVAAALTLAHKHNLRDGTVVISGDAGWKTWPTP
ncbi:pyridoxal-phosphate dependent enzyme [Actinomadura barringtoniae]|uniref:Pyridoxal-phosphate dependent enzyme n=1 Tax=Actinomadura barringtoniae TaxID=1427535 RepID=A0A939T6A6_9ACTN|nr:pyridoxal-phosphate dependent enzyme [Actinomadura barringtoniae]